MQKWDWVWGILLGDDDIHCSTRRSPSRRYQNYIFGAGDPTPLTKYRWVEDISSWTHCSEYLALHLERASLKGQLVCQRESAFGLLLKGCFLRSCRRKSPVGGWGKITKESFDSTWLGTLLNHPISDISPNAGLLGRFPFQPQSVVSAAFQDKIPHF